MWHLIWRNYVKLNYLTMGLEWKVCDRNTCNMIFGPEFVNTNFRFLTNSCKDLFLFPVRLQMSYLVVLKHCCIFPKLSLTLLTVSLFLSQGKRWRFIWSLIKGMHQCTLALFTSFHSFSFQNSTRAVLLASQSILASS